MYGSMPCGLSMVITQQIPLPTVAILLCATSSILESFSACLLAVLALPIVTIFCLPISLHLHLAGLDTTPALLT